MVRQFEQSSLFDLSSFSRPDKSKIGDWDWENDSNASEPEIRRFKVGDRIQAKLPNSPEGVVVEIKQGKYPWSDTILIEWDKGVPRKQKGTRSAISAGKALLLASAESYPTESVIEEDEPSGKTEQDERDEAIAQEYAETMITIVNLARKYNISDSETVDILSARLGERYSELVEFKRQENQKRYLTKDEIAPDAAGNYPPLPNQETTSSFNFAIEEKYGPIDSWPDLPEGEGFFDFLSYPTEPANIIDASSGKTDDCDLIPTIEDLPETSSYPTETGNIIDAATGKTIWQQIRPMPLDEKRSLLNWLQRLIEMEEDFPPPPVKSGRQVVGEPVRTSRGYRRQELVRCGKATCKSCPHGPYWYEYWSEGGKRKSKYVGKNP